MSRPIPFLTGVPRSGTTMIRLMLNVHPDIAFPGETILWDVAYNAVHLDDKSADPIEYLIQNCTATGDGWLNLHISESDWRAAITGTDPVQALHALFSLYARRKGKPRWGEKSPGYAGSIRRLASILPDARFVHIVRDCRAVVNSLQNCVFGNGMTTGNLAEYWAAMVSTIENEGKETGRFLTVQYEEAIADPQGTLSTLCDFLDLPHDEATINGMLEFYKTADAALAEESSWTLNDGSPIKPSDRAVMLANLSTPVTSVRVDAWQESLSAAQEQTILEKAEDQMSLVGIPL